MSYDTNPVNGGAMPKTTPSLIRFDRRQFIGGSDARIIMGKDERPSCGSGGRSAARATRQIYQES